MSITVGDIKELREQTGVGMMECKKALTEADGNLEKALEVLRIKGLAMAAKKSTRAASEGLVTSYIHMNRIGVLLEINCETDFVAKTDIFQEFIKDVAMHIAAANPSYVRREEIPTEIVEKEKEIYSAQITGKPPQVIEKILEGKIEKFYSESCLLDQIFVKDAEGKKTINDLLVEKVAKLGENIVVNRFARFQIGEKN